MVWRNLASLWSPRFDQRAGKTVAAIIDLMFPGDGVPGAKSLGIPGRIVGMSDLRELMAAGVAWLDDWATRQGATHFLALDEIGKQKALEAASLSKDEFASQFVYSIRFYGGLMYYSEPVIKTTFPYTGPPQPEGFPDFTGPPQ